MTALLLHEWSSIEFWDTLSLRSDVTCRSNISIQHSFYFLFLDAFLQGCQLVWATPTRKGGN